MPRVLVADLLDGDVLFFDATTRKRLGRVPVGASPQGLTVAKNGKFGYVTSASEGTVSVLDVIRMKETARADLDGFDDPGAIAVLPDGRSLFIVDTRGTEAAVVDASSGKVRHRIATGGNVTGAFAVNEPGDRVWLADPEHARVIALDPRAGRRVAERSVEGRPCAVALGRDGRTLLVTRRTPAALVVDPPEGSGAPAREIPTGANPVQVAAHPYRDQAFVLSRGDGSVLLADLRTGETSKPMAVGLGPNAFTVARAGKTLYVTNGESDNVSVVDVASGEVKETWDTGHNPGPVVYI